MPNPKFLNDSDLSLYDFMLLDRASQWALIFATSNPITTIRLGDRVFRLYGINTFYVELELELFTHKFIKMGILKSGKKLDKYLKGLPLTVRSN